MLYAPLMFLSQKKELHAYLVIILVTNENFLSHEIRKYLFQDFTPYKISHIVHRVTRIV